MSGELILLSPLETNVNSNATHKILRMQAKNTRLVGKDLLGIGKLVLLIGLSKFQLNR